MRVVLECMRADWVVVCASSVTHSLLGDWLMVTACSRLRTRSWTDGGLVRRSSKTVRVFAQLPSAGGPSQGVSLDTFLELAVRELDAMTAEEDDESDEAQRTQLSCLQCLSGVALPGCPTVPNLVPRTLTVEQATRLWRAIAQPVRQDSRSSVERWRPALDVIAGSVRAVAAGTCGVGLAPSAGFPSD